MSDMLNKRCTLTKLRTELEGREERLCRQCGRFRYHAWNCKSREEQKKTVTANRFEALGSQVIQHGVREVRRQEMVREEVKCFRCGEKGHKKWECPNMKKHEKEKAGGCGTTARSVEESEGA